MGELRACAVTDVTLEQAVAVEKAPEKSEKVALGYLPVQHSALKNAEIIPMSLRSVHFVMPGGVDDASAPSGGNAYDRRVSLDLPGFGWQVHKHAVDGSWPSLGRRRAPNSPARWGSSPTGPSSCWTDWSPAGCPRSSSRKRNG